MRQIAVLVAVLILALVFNSLLPRGSEQQLDRATVEKFIIEDAKQTFGENALYNIMKYEKRDSKWAVELDVTISAPRPDTGESTCSRTIRRYYSLFPIVFREELWSTNC